MSVTDKEKQKQMDALINETRGNKQIKIILHLGISQGRGKLRNLTSTEEMHPQSKPTKDNF